MAIKFLVVDDSKVMRQMIIQTIYKGNIFKPENTTMIEASDGVEGLEAIRSQNPNVILTGWNMPNMDGLSMIKEIRKTNKNIPIVMITAEATEDRMRKALSGGLATDYIVKPLLPGVLEERLMKKFGVSKGDTAS